MSKVKSQCGPGKMKSDKSGSRKDRRATEALGDILQTHLSDYSERALSRRRWLAQAGTKSRKHRKVGAWSDD